MAFEVIGWLEVRLLLPILLLDCLLLITFEFLSFRVYWLELLLTWAFPWRLEIYFLEFWVDPASVTVIVRGDVDVVGVTIFDIDANEYEGVITLTVFAA